ncbi:MAG: peptidylprolyl isomerase [Clostridiales bacterium]|nr:peptidylprolyl isomerase [Clostridiales bacterium]
MEFVQNNESTDLVKIETSAGDIVIELDSLAAPITVENFKSLITKKFYDGLIFHRVIKGFMIQGGDPTGTGYGGSDKQIKGEFAINGVNNTLSHRRGVISMARSQMPNSASSQFFICHADATFLDGQYASFGKVVQGIETVDKIAMAKTDSNDRPRENQVINKAYFVK